MKKCLFLYLIGSKKAVKGIGKEGKAISLKIDDPIRWYSNPRILEHLGKEMLIKMIESEYSKEVKKYKEKLFGKTYGNRG